MSAPPLFHNCTSEHLETSHFPICPSLCPWLDVSRLEVSSLRLQPTRTASSPSASALAGKLAHAQKFSVMFSTVGVKMAVLLPLHWDPV